MNRSDEMTERELYEYLTGHLEGEYGTRDDVPRMSLRWAKVTRRARRTGDGTWKAPESFPQDLNIAASVALGPPTADGQDTVHASLKEGDYSWQDGVEGGRLDDAAADRLADKLIAKIDEALSPDVCECCGQEVAE